MKPLSLVAAGSLLANLALLGALAARPSLAPAGVRDFFARNFHVGEEAVPAPKPAATRPVLVAKKPLWKELDTGGDLAGLIVRLQAAGFPADVIRAMIQAEVGRRYDARLRAFFEPDPNVPFWRQRPGYFNVGDKRMADYEALQRERSNLLRELFKGDFFTSAEVTAAQRQQFGNLPREKIDQIQRIENDYAEMLSAVRSAMGGITLPEDQQKLALLAREKKADLAAILSPEELADYEMRSSEITRILRTQVGAFDPSEAEFRALYQAQLAVNDKFTSARASLADYELRQAAQRDSVAQLKAALGDARYADYVRETSRDYQQLNRMAEQANLPRETTIQAYNMRDAVAAESNRIYDNAALTDEQMRAAFQTLAQDTRTKLLAILGPTVGPNYVKVVDQWLNTVARGAAVTFDGTPALLIIDGGSTYTLGSSPRFRMLRPANPPGPP